MKGKCRECREVFRGRSDKIFCSDHCRSAFNNRRNRDRTNLMRTVHNRLRRNHRILAGLLGEDRQKAVRRNRLADLGFDFQWVTSVIRNPGAEPEYRLYDLGYQFLNDLFCIVFAQGEAGGSTSLFPVVGVEFEGGHHDILAADLPDQQAILHNGQAPAVVLVEYPGGIED